MINTAIRFYLALAFYIYGMSVGLLADETIPVSGAGDSWLIGQWEMHFDPDGGKKDFIEFKANGDAVSRGYLGEVEGFYIVGQDRVRAMFTHRGKDVILTFFFNKARDELRIVTSHTGRETLYRKSR